MVIIRSGRFASGDVYWFGDPDYYCPVCDTLLEVREDELEGTRLCDVALICLACGWSATALDQSTFCEGWAHVLGELKKHVVLITEPRKE